jgi:hypothetical protein
MDMLINIVMMGIITKTHLIMTFIVQLDLKEDSKIILAKMEEIKINNLLGLED